MGAGVGRDWVQDGPVTRRRGACDEEAACRVPAGGGGRGPAARSREEEDRQRGALGGGKESGRSDQPHVWWGRNKKKQAMTVLATETLATLVLFVGYWIITYSDGCRRTWTVPVYSGGVIFLDALGGVIFLISLIGFLGAWKNVSCLLWTFLTMLFVVLVAIMVFTVLAFIITNTGSGHTVPGARYKEYRLQDYSSWFVKQLNDTEKWTRLKSCLVKT